MLWASTGRIRGANKVHAHDMNELVVCLSDTGEHVIYDRSYPFRSGSTVYLPGGVPHYVVGSEAGVAHIEFVCFDHQLLMDQANSALRDSLSALTAEKRFAAFGDDRVRAENLDLSRRLQDELKGVRFLGQTLAGSLTEQLLVNHCRALLSGERPLADDGARRIAEVCSRITEDPSEHVDLEGAAREAGMSRTVFVNRFKKQMGMTLIEYVLSVRMNRAMNLLTESDRKISDIALACGFNNLAYFHRSFRKHSGMTPKAYRTRVADQGQTPRPIRLLKTRR